MVSATWRVVLLLQRIPRSCLSGLLSFASLTMVRQVWYNRSFSGLPVVGAFFDFTADLASKDTAYTSLALGAHTDTTYFSDPIGLQMLHILHHTQGSGGASLLVDGFRAAMTLKEEDPEAYRILSEVRVPTHASGNEDVSIRPSVPFPVLNHHPLTGDLMQVRWNNDDRATMDRWKSEAELEAWYHAARKWSHMLKRDQSEYWEQLRPGRPLSESTHHECHVDAKQASL